MITNNAKYICIIYSFASIVMMYVSNNADFATCTCEMLTTEIMTKIKYTNKYDNGQAVENNKIEF